MIHYDLVCAHGHDFDGWFRDSAAFEAQVGAGLLDCPVCGDVAVRRALMAPRIAAARGMSTPEAPPPGSAAPRDEHASRAEAARQVALTPERLPAAIRSQLQRLRAEVERQCDYVGPAFAETARQIHRGEEQARPIYGETSPEQAEALAEEGIEIARIPWLPRADG